MVPVEIAAAALQVDLPWATEIDNNSFDPILIVTVEQVRDLLGKARDRRQACRNNTPPGLPPE